MGISPINRDAIYRTRSSSLDISQYIIDNRQTQILLLKMSIQNRISGRGVGFFALYHEEEFLHVGENFGEKRKHLYLTLKSDNKEQIVETRGQTKLLHGKPFPTASQFQGRSRFEEGW